mgnify:CR=1 FL=1
MGTRTSTTWKAQYTEATVERDEFTLESALAIAQGCPPDTISSDIHVFSGNTPGMPYLTWVMSKFLTLGFTLPQVVQMASAAPAQIGRAHV